jgi:hypothetical protein
MNILTSVLNSIDNAAKETLEEPRQLSATQIRSQRRTHLKGSEDTLDDSLNVS